MPATGLNPPFPSPVGDYTQTWKQICFNIVLDKYEIIGYNVTVCTIDTSNLFASMQAFI